MAILGDGCRGTRMPISIRFTRLKSDASDEGRGVIAVAVVDQAGEPAASGHAEGAGEQDGGNAP